MRPCTCDRCHLCRLYRHDSRYRALWGGASGSDAQRSEVRGQKSAPCRHLGPATGATAGCPTCRGRVELKLFACAVHGSCTPAKAAPGVACCAGCPDREAAPAFAPLPGDPPCGVAVGCYDFPGLALLQARLIRRHCGPVPVLVSDDCSPGRDELARALADEPGVYLWPNATRLGHTGGDLATFWKGLVWAKALGLKAVAKLSQRFLVDAPRWLQGGARELLASGLPLASRRCRGREVFDLRTEACLLDVDAWHRPGVLAALAPRRRLAPELAEATVWGLLRDRLGGLYWPWALLGEERYQRRPGVVWHCSHGPGAYHALAAREGVGLGADFHCEGWQRARDYVR